MAELQDDIEAGSAPGHCQCSGGASAGPSGAGLSLRLCPYKHLACGEFKRCSATSCTALLCLVRSASGVQSDRDDEQGTASAVPCRDKILALPSCDPSRPFR